MKANRARSIMAALAVAIGASIACGGASSSLSPTGPSGLSGTSGAIVTGRVSGAPVSRATVNSLTTASSISRAASTSLRVTISGTDISTTVDGAGNFTLTGVPPGTVTLTFTGPDVSASITLSGVAAGETINIAVTLTNSSARVDSESRHRDHDDGDDDDDDEAEDEDELDEVEGAVSGLTGTCPAITFVVQGVTVTTSSTTRFDEGCSRIADMVRVEAKGTFSADRRTLTAHHVELD